jgi:hypothetical protein
VSFDHTTAHPQLIVTDWVGGTNDAFVTLDGGQIDVVDATPSVLDDEYLVDVQARMVLHIRNYTGPNAGGFSGFWPGSFRLRKGASYATGTVSVTTGTVTLVGGTWPSWAAEGTFTVGGVSYAVASRTSDSIIVLNNTTITGLSGETYSLNLYPYVTVTGCKFDVVAEPEEIIDETNGDAGITVVFRDNVNGQSNLPLTDKIYTTTGP